MRLEGFLVDELVQVIVPLSTRLFFIPPAEHFLKISTQDVQCPPDWIHPLDVPLVLRRLIAETPPDDNSTTSNGRKTTLPDSWKCPEKHRCGVLGGCEWSVERCGAD